MSAEPSGGVILDDFVAVLFAADRFRPGTLVSDLPETLADMAATIAAVASVADLPETLAELAAAIAAVQRVLRP